VTFWIILVAVVAVGLYVGVNKQKRITSGQGPNVVVETVKGDSAARRRIEFMLANGYELQGQGTRKVVWSPVTGVFTRKQKHTLTFVKKPAA
jgi:hypothetical protein